MSDFPELKRPKQPTFERALMDYDNPRSVVNLVSPDLADLIRALPEDIVDVTEEELLKKYPDPLPTVQQIRRLFWAEFDRAIQTRMKMELTFCYSGVCTREGFRKIVHKPENLAWIVCPPKDYMMEVEDLLTVGLRQVRMILNLPLITSLGSIDTKLADVQLRAVMMLDQRLKGGYVHRSMQISHNTNEYKSNITTSDAVDSKDSGLSIDEKLKQIELEIKAVEKIPPPQAPDVRLTKAQKLALDRNTIADADFVEVESDGK